MKRVSLMLLAVIALVSLALFATSAPAQNLVKNYFVGCTGVNCDNIFHASGTVYIDTNGTLMLNGGALKGPTANAGVTASGATSCTIKRIENGIITTATCS